MDSNTSSGDDPVDTAAENTQQEQPTSTNQQTEATGQATNDDSSSTANAVAPEQGQQDQQPPSQEDSGEESTPENPSPSSEPPAETPELEHAYWAEFEEDTSEPNESEMKEIEAASDTDCSAHDYDCLEKDVFPDLGDPEYRPVEKARISWKIKGVRGTKNCPNRAKLMCSPPAYVGGYWWTIKFFPRGNKVSSLSVYLECSSTIPSPDKILPESEFKVLRGNPDAVLKDCSPDVDIRYNKTDESNAWLEYYKSQYPAAQQTYAQKDSWNVTAQVGVMIYNPAEPRTGSMQSSAHQFNPNNYDWGWTTFHGPWDQIHRRQRGQRQALLRNDTVAFDAYIRIIDDPTRFLWWHSCEKQPTWDSLGLTGYRPLGDSASNHSAEVAGLACWLNITPFCEIIKSIDVLEHCTNCDVKPKPLCEALQKVLWQLHSRDESLHEVDTHDVTFTLRNLQEYSGDVSEFWERLRRTLELELAGTKAGKEFAKLFDSPALPVTGVVANTLPRDFNSRICVPADQTKTIHEALGRYFGAKPGPWSLPPVLHIELNRQKLDHAAHQWKLLYNRVDLDERLDLAPWVLDEQCGEYVLYGYVVHRGRRTSNKFFSIIRPGGPGTKWLAFDDGSDNLVECLTRKTAFGSHLGLEPSETPDHKRGHDIAVSVLYIRSDVVGKFLTGPQGPWDVPTPLNEYFELGIYSLTKKAAAGKSENEDLRVELYSGSQYENMDSLFDSYDLMSQAKSSNNVVYLTVPRSWTYVELRKQIAKCKSSHTESVPSENVRLWQIGHARERYGAVLAISRVSNLNDTLDLPLNIARFWLQIVSGEDAKDFAMPDPPPKKVVSETKPEETVRERERSESSDERQSTPERDEQPTSAAPLDLNTEAEQPSSEISSNNTNSPAATPPSSRSDSSLVAGANGDNGAPAITSDSQETASAAPSQAQQEPSAIPPPNPEEQQDSRQDQPASTTDSANALPAEPTGPAAISLLLVQEPRRETPPAPDNDDTESEESEPEPEPEVQLPVRHIYYFVQIFDAEKQVLRAVGSFFSRADENVKAALRKRLERPDQKDFGIWMRKDGTSVRTIAAGQTFAAVGEDGACFIVGDRLTRDKRNELHQAGLFTTPERLVQYLWALSRQHPMHSFTGFKTIEATFTGDYYSGNLHKGFYHGRGKHISDLAAIYEGNFFFGRRQGKGSIEYPTGDTYNGDWLDDQQHGQGIFVERKTGNKYVGGYKNGRRHGKGTTYWEVADEELDLCQICYSEEQDALFYDCGHVCACVECASQVDICPICRKNILRVVRIYRS